MFAQCVPTTTPATGDTVTCSGAGITTPVIAQSGSTGVTINVDPGAAISGTNNGASVQLLSVEMTSVINNKGALTLDGTLGSASSRGVAMLGNASNTGGDSNKLYNYGSINTTGPYNVGMAASGGGNLLLNALGATISTNGNSAYGMSSGWLPAGNIGGIQDANTITNNGKVTVSGPSSRAVSIIGSNSTVNNGVQATLSATNSSSTGVYLNGTNDSLFNSGVISSSGQAVNVNMVQTSLQTFITNSASGKIISTSTSSSNPAINISTGRATINNGGLIQGAVTAIQGNPASSLNLNLRVTSQITGDVNGGGSSTYGNTLTLLAQTQQSDGPTLTTGSVTNSFTNFDSLTVQSTTPPNPGVTVVGSQWKWSGSGDFNKTITVQPGSTLTIVSGGIMGKSASTAVVNYGTVTVASGGEIDCLSFVNNGTLNNNGTITCTPMGAPPITAPVISGPLQNGMVSVNYTDMPQNTGSPATWSVSGGALPDGLSLNPVTGEIYGTPTKAGTFNFNLTASNTAGSDTESFSITISDVPPAITTLSGTLPDGTVGASYIKALTYSGSAAAWTWAPTGTSTSLPPGLSIDPDTGVISGTPTKAGTFSFTATVTNSAGSVSEDFSITIRLASATTTAVPTLDAKTLLLLALLLGGMTAGAMLRRG